MGDNNEHLSIEDMISFISMTKVDEDFFEMAARVNSHIYKCRECRENYETLLAASEAIENAVLFVPKSQMAYFNLIKGLYLFENKREKTKKKLSECIDAIKDLTYLVQVNVASLGEIACNSLSGESQFYHPAFAVGGKSFSNSPEDVQTGIIKSTVIDEDNNKVTIGQDGTLSLFFNKDECYPGTIVILIPEDASQEPLFEYSVEDSHSEDMAVVKFEDVTPGNYTVAFKE